MGIILDIILIAILLLSTFLGYKKGLVKLAAKLFAGIIAIIVTIIAYKPISGMIINNTQLDEKIEQVIINNFVVDENGNIIKDVENKVIKEQAKNLSKSAVYVITGIVLFLAVKIILSIIISLVDFIADLPILKQFNEIGGILYGIIRGALIICVLVLIIGIITKINPQNDLNNKVDSSYLTKIIYENIVKF